MMTMIEAEATVRELAEEQLQRFGAGWRIGKGKLIDQAELEVPRGDRVLGCWFARTRRGQALLVVTDRRLLLVGSKFSSTIAADRVAGVHTTKTRLVVESPGGQRLELQMRFVPEAAAAVREVVG